MAYKFRYLELIMNKADHRKFWLYSYKVAALIEPPLPPEPYIPSSLDICSSVIASVTASTCGSSPLYHSEMSPSTFHTL